MDRISSRQNPLVKRFRELVRAGADHREVLLDGEHLVSEAIVSRVPLELVAVSDRLARGRLSALVTDLKRAGVKIVAVTDPVLAAISPVQHPSGVVGIARRLPATLDQVFHLSPQLLLLVADVQDPGNIGAIVRTAEAAGATGMVTSGGCADPFGWKALRGGMGSTFRLPVARHDLAEVVARAKTMGLKLAAMVPRGGADPTDVDFRVPCAILLGAEGAGLARELSAAADLPVTIPMRPPVESLNVAVAAAIVLYEASRQRRAKI
jgi:TrmH family RNA methyltransferase